MRIKIIVHLVGEFILFMLFHTSRNGGPGDGSESLNFFNSFFILEIKNRVSGSFHAMRFAAVSTSSGPFSIVCSLMGIDDEPPKWTWGLPLVSNFGDGAPCILVSLVTSLAPV